MSDRAALAHAPSWCWSLSGFGMQVNVALVSKMDCRSTALMLAVLVSLVIRFLERLKHRSLMARGGWRGPQGRVPIGGRAGMSRDDE
jgi:hypothetical protein